MIGEFRGLTQTRLAEESGVDQSQISALENHRRTGMAVTLKAIAKALGAPLEALVEDDRGALAVARVVGTVSPGVGRTEGGAWSAGLRTRVNKR